jgi:formylglycine-generating enzyme required for sulfatase activity/predicted Ser/Thr protein kinase
VLSAELTRDTAFVKRFRREAQAAAALSHPGIIPIYAIGEADGVHYFAMEYVKGLTLAEYLRKYGPIRPRQALNLVAQVASALVAAHEAGVIHRDIKPQNIMIDEAGRVRVMDFGLAKRTEDPSATNLTLAGAFLGTVRYASPEQCGGDPIDARSDLYSLGVVFYEVLAGGLPYEARTSARLIREILLGKIRPLEQIRADLAPEVLQIVHSLLRTMPEERPSSARELVAALKDLRDRKVPLVRAVAQGVAGSLTPGVPSRPSQESPSGVSSGSGLLPEVPADFSRVAPPSEEPEATAQHLILSPSTPGRVPVEPPVPAPRRRWPLFAVAALALAAIVLVGFSSRGRIVAAIRRATGQPETAVATASGGDTVSGQNYTEDLGGGVALEMIWVRGGKFQMGSPSSELERTDDEGPQTEVALSGFWMAKFETAQDQYERITGSNPSMNIGSDNPVETVSWHDAVEFCKKLSDRTGKTYALPTEAQWEYACRAGTTSPFSLGDTISTDRANYDGDRAYGPGKKGNQRLKTVLADSFRPNAWGLANMHGNVSEWCLSEHRPYPYREDDSRNDPAGSAPRVVRGGSWADPPAACRSACRAEVDPATQSKGIGFRVACVPRQQK